MDGCSWAPCADPSPSLLDHSPFPSRESSAGRGLHSALGAELSRASIPATGIFGNNAPWERWEPLHCPLLGFPAAGLTQIPIFLLTADALHLGTG